MATEKMFLSNIKITPIFFNRKKILCSNILKRKICWQKLVFCEYNVALDTQILILFSISHNNSFEKRWKLLFLLHDFFMYALMNVW